MCVGKRCQREWREQRGPVFRHTCQRGMPLPGSCQNQLRRALPAWPARHCGAPQRQRVAADQAATHAGGVPSRPPTPPTPPQSSSSAAAASAFAAAKAGLPLCPGCSGWQGAAPRGGPPSTPRRAPALTPADRGGSRMGAMPSSLYPCAGTSQGPGRPQDRSTNQCQPKAAAGPTGATGGGGGRCFWGDGWWSVRFPTCVRARERGRLLSESSSPGTPRTHSSPSSLALSITLHPPGRRSTAAARHAHRQAQVRHRPADSAPESTDGSCPPGAGT
jgi:hypothetical protein